MADTQASSPSAYTLNVEQVRARLAWAVKPLGFVLLVLWVLHPNTVNRPTYTHVSLFGFVCGTLYGLAFYGQTLKRFVSLNNVHSRLRPNRVPEEYYWGNIVQVLFDNTKK